VPNELYSPNSEATVGYVQTGSPQPSGFAMNVGVCSSHFDCIADTVYKCGKYVLCVRVNPVSDYLLVIFE